MPFETHKKTHVTFGESLKNEFGRKIYKLALDIGCTCPTRDGTLGDRGCIFCSAAGSGEFTQRYTGKEEELEEAKRRLGAKIDVSSAGFLPYFQNFTNTYAPVEYLEPLFSAAAGSKDCVGISIATRPDCLGDDVMLMLERLCKKTCVFVELGLQTIHPKTAEFIRRGYALEVFDDAARKLSTIGARVVVHLIFGLPYPPDPGDPRKLELESKEMIIGSVRHVASLPVSGVKFQLLHILRGTDLAALYEAGCFRALEMDEYVDLVSSAISVLPPETVVHRLTGDAPRKELIAPLWSLDKKRVMNAVFSKL